MYGMLSISFFEETEISFTKKKLYWISVKKKNKNSMLTSNSISCLYLFFLPKVNHNFLIKPQKLLNILESNLHSFTYKYDSYLKITKSVVEIVILITVNILKWVPLDSR